LIVWAPGTTPGRVSHDVALIDIAQTVLGFLCVQPIPGAEGQDLLAPVARYQPVYSEVDATYYNTSPFAYASFFSYAITDRDWSLVYDPRRNTWELYNLVADPRELHNLVDREPEHLARMRASLIKWLDNTDSPPQPR
jgi:arylsulfatase A-like enzyme